MQSTELTVSGTGSDLSARSLWDAYSSELDVSEKTLATYKRALSQFDKWLDAQGITPLEAKREDVIGYKRSLEESKAAATVNAYLTAVRGLYAWLESKGIYPNVAAGIKGEKTSSHSTKDALTVSQARKLLSDHHDGLAGLRDHAMITLMLRRGLRTIEVSRANVGDLRQEAGKAVLYVQGKGHASKDDFVVLGDDCLTPIYAYLAARGSVSDDDPLFAATGNRNQGGRMSTRSISRITKSYLVESGANSPRLTAHSLRHTAVTFALMGGADPQEVQTMARHASITTTMRYAHNLDKLEAKAEKAVDSVLDQANTGEHTTEHKSEHNVSTLSPAEMSEANTKPNTIEHKSEHMNRLFVLASEHAFNRANVKSEHISEHTASTMKEAVNA